MFHAATQITFHVEQFPLQKLAARQQHSLLLSQLRLHTTGLNRPTRIIWAIPGASAPIPNPDHRGTLEPHPRTPNAPPRVMPSAMAPRPDCV
jgi:hypothetical protein